MTDEFFIRTAVIMGVLMDVDDGFRRCCNSLCGAEAWREQKRGGRADEFAAGQT